MKLKMHLESTYNYCHVIILYSLCDIIKEVALAEWLCVGLIGNAMWCVQLMMIVVVHDDVG